MESEITTSSYPYPGATCTCGQAQNHYNIGQRQYGQVLLGPPRVIPIDQEYLRVGSPQSVYMQYRQGNLQSHNQPVAYGRTRPNTEWIRSFKEPRPSEVRYSYVPYQRYYTEVEEQRIVVPVEKIRMAYYQKIFETHFVSQKVEELVQELQPIAKTIMTLEYVPVEKKIVHLPQDMCQDQLGTGNIQKIRKTITINQKKAESASLRLAQPTKVSVKEVMSMVQFEKHPSINYFAESNVKEVYPSIQNTLEIAEQIMPSQQKSQSKQTGAFFTTPAANLSKQTGATSVPRSAFSRPAESIFRKPQ